MHFKFCLKLIIELCDGLQGNSIRSSEHLQDVQSCQTVKIGLCSRVKSRLS